MKTAEPELLIDGAQILDDAWDFAQTILYMPDEMFWALILACAASHTLNSFTTICRLLVTSKSPLSGKSTFLRAVIMLGNNAWKSKPTSYALRSKFNAREKPLVIVDEISEIYGKAGLGRGQPDLNTILKEGYESNAMLSLSVDRDTVDVSCFCMAAVGGLSNAVPYDIWTRSIPFKMSTVPAGIRLRDSLDADTEALAAPHRQRMHQWARANEKEIQHAFKNLRRVHPKLYSRLRQIWGPLFAVAAVAGGEWPSRCLAAFKAMALDASEQPVLTTEQRILLDTARLFRKTGADTLSTKDIAGWLRGIPDVEVYEVLSDRELAIQMSKALGTVGVVAVEGQQRKGYRARKVLAAAAQLEAALTPPAEEEPEEDEFDTFFEDDLTEVTVVTA